MATYIEYRLEGGGTLWIETEKVAGKAIKASAADESGNVVIKAKEMFQDALASVRQSAVSLRQGLSVLDADEVEVTFGIKTVGEAGFFVVGKTGAEMNYEVTLRWTKKELSNS